MKIGVYPQEYLPERGGSYTFESQILEAFLILANQSKHQFTVLGKTPPYLFRLNQKVDFTDHSLSSPKLLKNFLSHSFSGKIKQTLPQIEKAKISARSRVHKRIAKQLRLDLIWSIVPGTYTQEVPYITPIFDLQHRLQPIFPEVGSYREWIKRENIIKLLVNRAALIITGTEVGKSEVELFYGVPAERIRVIPFPTPLFEDKDKDLDGSNWVCRKYNLPDKYLFYPAQFWPHKNHANLLLAISQLKQQFDLTVPVVFVGANKGNWEYIKTLISQYGLSAQVKCLGFVSRSDLSALYKQAIALTFVSFFGPDNLPPLEAFSLGCPVIAADVPGAKEQLGDAARLVDPKDANQIAMAIKSFWENATLRQDYVQKGYERANRWTAQDYVEQVFKIFDELEPILNCWQD